MSEYTNSYYLDTFPEDAEGVVRDGYVRVMCWNRSACLQIREDIINQSQLMNVLADARDLSNLSECIHMANELATANIIKIICDWLAKHIEFQGRDAPAEERRAFDQRFFLLNPAGHAAYDAEFTDNAKADILDSRKDWLRWRLDDPENEDPKRSTIFPSCVRTPAFERTRPIQERLHRTYEEIQQIMFVANFLELHKTDWHTAFAEKEVERLATQPTGPFQEYGLDPADKFAETVMELCCHHLGDIILSCESPVEMQHRFSKLIGAKALTAKDRYDIVTADLWIHGDDFVESVVSELQVAQQQEYTQARASGISEEDIQNKFGKPIPDWTLESTQEERAFMKEVPGQEGNPTLRVPAIKVNDQQSADAGFEIGHHWWG
jgi:hypothetical protein